MSNFTSYQTPHNLQVKEIISQTEFTGDYYRIDRGPNYIQRWNTASTVQTDLTDYITLQPDLSLPAPVEVNPGSGDGLFFLEECEAVPCDLFDGEATQCTVNCVNEFSCGG